MAEVRSSCAAQQRHGPVGANRTALRTVHGQIGRLPVHIGTKVLHIRTAHGGIGTNLGHIRTKLGRIGRKPDRVRLSNLLKVCPNVPEVCPNVPEPRSNLSGICSNLARVRSNQASSDAGRKDFPSPSDPVSIRRSPPTSCRCSRAEASRRNLCRRRVDC